MLYVALKWFGRALDVNENEDWKCIIKMIFVWANFVRFI